MELKKLEMEPELFNLTFSFLCQPDFARFHQAYASNASGHRVHVAATAHHS